ncbi:flagellar hook-length control protein FliK [Epibacterium sp. Ofav1-8]|nr:flagellar hook-length control protein FliK [Epibacterium sp. Ofav1-8]
MVALTDSAQETKSTVAPQAGGAADASGKADATPNPAAAGEEQAAASPAAKPDGSAGAKADANASADTSRGTGGTAAQQNTATPATSEAGGVQTAVAAGEGKESGTGPRADKADHPMAAVRADQMAAQETRNATSVPLEQHRDMQRRQVAGLSGQPTDMPASPPKTRSAPQQEAAIPGLIPQPTADKDATPLRLRDMPLTGQQAQFTSATPPMRANVTPASARTAAPSITGSTPAGGALQSLSGTSVLQTPSFVVTGVFGASDSARVGEDVLTQRGAESFALPQLLAEASVRSGAANYRAETPRHVAQQLAEAVATAGRRNVDVSLNPRELGHVNMRLVTTDVGVTVTINAERPETEDLMRRHIQDLAREFKEMGFSDISFQFGSDTQAGDTGEDDGASASGSGGRGSDDDAGANIDERADQLPSQQLNIAADGLDMRI